MVRDAAGGGAMDSCEMDPRGVEAADDESSPPADCLVSGLDAVSLTTDRFGAGAKGVSCEMDPLGVEDTDDGSDGCWMSGGLVSFGLLLGGSLTEERLDEGYCSCGWDTGGLDCFTEERFGETESLAGMS